MKTAKPVVAKAPSVDDERIIRLLEAEQSAHRALVEAQQELNHVKHALFTSVIESGRFELLQINRGALRKFLRQNRDLQAQG